ncbi:MAG TPA: PIN domain-containing protein, partial [Coriobacteriia bacterium]|nr:PIN domain-containing protein [Coriobacteriia bacterium]
LDVLMEREPHVDEASKLFALVDNGHIEGRVCATTVTTIYYIAAKSFGGRRARDQVHELLGLFDVASVDGDVLDSALDLDFSDYEDAVLHEAARAAGATAIVTRDRAGFARATIPALAPTELLAVIAALE